MIRFPKIAAIGLAIACLLPLRIARAQHLWWNAGGERAATCAYGEITVLATHPGTYYCGLNWHPGEPAGGYCGIQDNTAQERRAIFSIWDTTPQLHPKVTAADKGAHVGRFGGEGTGAHVHIRSSWKLGETFQFFIEKAPGRLSDTTDARYYVFDPVQRKWLHCATITSPGGGKPSVATLGGGLNSFLENFSGRDRDAPRLALYRLWLGTSPIHLKYLREAEGDGRWGELHDAYFLAAGSEAKLNATFARLEQQYGKPAFGGKRQKLEAISDRALPDKLVEALKHLPQAPAVPP